MTNNEFVLKEKRYRILRKLGAEGYFATAFLAVNIDDPTDRVVIKMLHPEILLNQQDISKQEGFVREAIIVDLLNNKSRLSASVQLLGVSPGCEEIKPRDVDKEDLDLIIQKYRCSSYNQIPNFMLDYPPTNQSEHQSLIESLRLLDGWLSEHPFGLPYLILEFIDDTYQSLDLLIESTQDISLAEKLAICRSFSAFLSGVHDEGIAYKDLKENHIFWSSSKQSLKVIDWNASVLTSSDNERSEDLQDFGKIIYRLYTENVYKKCDKRTEGSRKQEISLASIIAIENPEMAIDFSPAKTIVPFGLQVIIERALWQAGDKIVGYQNARMMTKDLHESGLDIWSDENNINLSFLTMATQRANAQRAKGLSTLRANDLDDALVFLGNSLFFAPTLSSACAYLEDRLLIKNRPSLDVVLEPFNKARQFLEKGDYKQAASLLEDGKLTDAQILANIISDFNNLLEQAKAYFKSGNYRDARNSYWLALQIDCGNSTVQEGWDNSLRASRLLEQAELANQKGDYIQLQMCLAEIEQQFGSSPQVQKLEARLKYIKLLEGADIDLRYDRYPNAISQLNQAIDLFDDEHVRNKLLFVRRIQDSLDDADRILQIGEYEKSFAILNSLVKEIPESKRLLRSIDLVTQEKISFEKALDFIENSRHKAVESNWAEANNYLRQAESALKRLALNPRIQSSLETIAKLRDEFIRSVVSYDQADALLKQGKYKEALAQIKNSLSLLADNREFKQLYEKIASSLDEVERVRAIKLLAESAWNSGDLDELQEQLASLKNISGDPYVQQMVESLEPLREKTSWAVRLLAEAQDCLQARSFDKALNRLIELQGINDQIPHARSLKKEIEKQKELAEIVDRLKSQADAALDQGDYTKAINHLRKSLELTSNENIRDRIKQLEVEQRVVEELLYLLENITNAEKNKTYRTPDEYKQSQHLLQNAFDNFHNITSGLSLNSPTKSAILVEHLCKRIAAGLDDWEKALVLIQNDELVGARTLLENARKNLPSIEFLISDKLNSVQQKITQKQQLENIKDQIEISLGVGDFDVAQNLLISLPSSITDPIIKQLDDQVKQAKRNHNDFTRYYQNGRKEFEQFRFKDAEENFKNADAIFQKFPNKTQSNLYNRIGKHDLDNYLNQLTERREDIQECQDAIKQAHFEKAKLLLDKLIKNFPLSKDKEVAELREFYKYSEELETIQADVEQKLLIADFKSAHEAYQNFQNRWKNNPGVRKLNGEKIISNIEKEEKAFTEKVELLNKIRNFHKKGQPNDLEYASQLIETALSEQTQSLSLDSLIHDAKQLRVINDQLRKVVSEIKIAWDRNVEVRKGDVVSWLEEKPWKKVENILVQALRQPEFLNVGYLEEMHEKIRNTIEDQKSEWSFLIDRGRSGLSKKDFQQARKYFTQALDCADNEEQTLSAQEWVYKLEKQEQEHAFTSNFYEALEEERYIEAGIHLREFEKKQPDHLEIQKWADDLKIRETASSSIRLTSETLQGYVFVWKQEAHSVLAKNELPENVELNKLENIYKKADIWRQNPSFASQLTVLDNEYKKAYKTFELLKNIKNYLKSNNFDAATSDAKRLGELLSDVSLGSEFCRIINLTAKKSTLEIQRTQDKDRLTKQIISAWKNQNYQLIVECYDQFVLKDLETSEVQDYKSRADKLIDLKSQMEKANNKKHWFKASSLAKDILKVDPENISAKNVQDLAQKELQKYKNLVTDGLKFFDQRKYSLASKQLKIIDDKLNKEVENFVEYESNFDFLQKFRNLRDLIQKKHDEFLKKGDDALQKRDHRLALQMFNDALALVPNSDLAKIGQSKAKKTLLRRVSISLGGFVFIVILGVSYILLLPHIPNCGQLPLCPEKNTPTTVFTPTPKKTKEPTAIPLPPSPIFTVTASPKITVSPAITTTNTPSGNSEKLIPFPALVNRVAAIFENPDSNSGNGVNIPPDLTIFVCQIDVSNKYYQINLEPDCSPAIGWVKVSNISIQFIQKNNNLVDFGNFSGFVAIVTVDQFGLYADVQSYRSNSSSLFLNNGDKLFVCRAGKDSESGFLIVIIDWKKPDCTKRTFLVKPAYTYLQPIIPVYDPTNKQQTP